MPPKVSDPVVIPPITGIDGKFSCIGNGLLYDGHARESPESLRMLLMPAGSGDAITDRSRPKSWWTAQALLYELSCPKTATITTIREKLELAVKAKSLQVPKTIKDMENKANREFKKLNKEVLEKTGGGGAPAAGPTKAATTKAVKAPATARAVEKKAPAKVADKAPPKASTNEKVPTKAPAKEKTPKVPKSASTSAPASIPAQKPRPMQTARKGTGGKAPMKREALEAFWDDDGDVIMMGESPAKKRKPSAKPRVKAEPLTGPYRGPIPVDAPPEDYGDYEDYEDYDDRAGPSGHHALSGDPPADPVAGSWDIQCPFIAGEWGDQYGDEFSLDLVRTNGRQHVEGDFDFGIVHGFLRSKRIEGRADGGVYVTFEWVGKESEGRVLTPHASSTGYMKIGRDANGMPTMKGRMQHVPACGADGVEFTGEWIGYCNGINRRWGDFDEAAYERANRARWGRGGGW